MAGAEDPEAAKLTGLAKHFNSITNRGRANIAMATYATIGLIVAFFVLKPKKAKK